MDRFYRRTLLLFITTGALGLFAASGGKSPTPEPTPRQPAGKIETPPLGARWIHGYADPDPAIQTFALDTDTYILRQNISLNFEAPFLYLLAGRERALLLDTGAANTNIARKFPLRETVDRLLTEWSKNRKREPVPLLVLHTHSHDDHTAGDPQFEGRAETEVVGTRLFDLLNFFKISSWPKQIVPLDLGGRRLMVLPTPGHDATHISVYDPQTESLFTGDTLYPGRLYVRDWKAYRQSVARLAKFSEGHAVKRILGGHIELTAKGQEYPETASYHPDERALELGPAELVELNDTLKDIGDKPPKEPVRKNAFTVVPAE